MSTVSSLQSPGVTLAAAGPRSRCNALATSSAPWSSISSAPCSGRWERWATGATAATLVRMTPPWVPFATSLLVALLSLMFGVPRGMASDLTAMHSACTDDACSKDRLCHGISGRSGKHISHAETAHPHQLIGGRRPGAAGLEGVDPLAEGVPLRPVPRLLQLQRVDPLRQLRDLPLQPRQLRLRAAWDCS